jgi:single-strand DNA-binding protein
MIGNLVRDPEIKYIPSGAAVTKFRLAVNPNKKDAKPEDTLYVDVVAWEKLAETCNLYLKQGWKVLVEGRLSIRSYEKDGDKRYATEIVANAVQFLSSPKESENGAVAAQAVGEAAAEPVDTDLAEEIPL